MSKYKTIEVLVRNNQDPIQIALNHTHCPICKESLDMEWKCLKCKKQLLFKQEDIL